MFHIAILLSGYLASGKDTVGDYLSTYGFRRYAFADTLRVQPKRGYDLFCFAALGPPRRRAHHGKVLQIMCSSGNVLVLNKKNNEIQVRPTFHRK